MNAIPASGTPMPGAHPVILHPWAGLANRILGVASTVECCQRLNRPVDIVWFRHRRRFNARFGDLFEPIVLPGVRLREATAFDALALGAPSWRENLKIPHLIQRVAFGKARVCYPNESYECARKGVVPEIFAKTGRTVLLFAGCDIIPRNGMPADRRLAIKELFQPCAKLREMIDEQQRSIPGRVRIGVHIRRGDHAQATKMSPESLFAKRMDAILSSGEADSFVLATDDLAVAERFSRRYGPKLFFRQGARDRATRVGMQSAVIDLWTLSKCTRILASAGSTFGPVAAAIGGIPCETASTAQMERK